jgi:hypothetical protein
MTGLPDGLWIAHQCEPDANGQIKLTAVLMDGDRPVERVWGHCDPADGKVGKARRYRMLDGSLEHRAAVYAKRTTGP